MRDKSKCITRTSLTDSRILVGEDLSANSFKGYFVARYSEPFERSGVSYRGRIQEGVKEGEGEVLAGYVTFAGDTREVDVRVGVSFISIDQARRSVPLLL